MSSWTRPIIIFGAAFFLSWELGSVVCKWLSDRRMLDLPNARSSHVRPTVRGGGLGIQGAIIIGLLALAWVSEIHILWLVPPILLLAAISFWDDIKSVSVGLRLGVHALAAIGILIITAGSMQENPGSWPLDDNILFSVSYFMVGGLWIIGLINAYNFMDGINGHAAFQTLITGVASAGIIVLATGKWSVLPLAFVIVAGAAGGFLPHNFPQAKMFMGDVGSVPLGGLMAFLILWTGAIFGWDIALPLAFLQGNFILDTGLTLMKRWRRGERLSEAHREHLYERLALVTGSHIRVILGENSILILAGFMLCFYPKAGPEMKYSLLAAVGGLWAVYYLAGDWFCRRLEKPDPV
jgi:UDP-N-acetylmuramyl pentapeptide phosphotransferase/UDP-N-acetylglucosamine-1-phosphate transferase